jgi:hypothetical protein
VFHGIARKGNTLPHSGPFPVLWPKGQRATGNSSGNTPLHSGPVSGIEHTATPRQGCCVAGPPCGGVFYPADWAAVGQRISRQSPQTGLETSRPSQRGTPLRSGLCNTPPHSGHSGPYSSIHHYTAPRHTAAQRAIQFNTPLHYPSTHRCTAGHTDQYTTTLHLDTPLHSGPYRSIHHYTAPRHTAAQRPIQFNTPLHCTSTHSCTAGHTVQYTTTLHLDTPLHSGPKPSQPVAAHSAASGQ